MYQCAKAIDEVIEKHEFKGVLKTSKLTSQRLTEVTKCKISD